MKGLCSKYGFFLFLILATAACDQFQNEPEKVSFFNDEYSIIKPGSWAKKSNINEEADLQLANYAKEAYFLAFVESKSDFDDISLNDYSDLSRSLIKESLNNLKEDNAEMLNINGKDAVKYAITGSINGVKLKYWHVSVESAKHFVQLVFWTLPSKFADNEADYQQAMMSFKTIN